jgi:hypothetical protein
MTDLPNELVARYCWPSEPRRLLRHSYAYWRGTTCAEVAEAESIVVRARAENYARAIVRAYGGDYTAAVPALSWEMLGRMIAAGTETRLGALAEAVR